MQSSRAELNPRPLSSEQEKEIKDIFSEYVKNKTDSVETKDLNVITRRIGLNPNEEQVEEIIQESDPIGSGFVTIENFLKSMTKRVRDHETEDALAEAFKMFDRDNNGLIGEAEFAHVLLAIGETLTQDEISEVFQEYDIDCDGSLTYEEFIRMMMSR